MNDRIAELRADIRYLTAQVVGMASAYETYAARHRSMGRAKVDALYGSRVQDYKRAAERAIEIARKYD